MKDKCGAGVDCPGLTEAQGFTQRLMLVDMIREVTRNLIGVLAVMGILWMLYQFVLLSPADDRMNVMLLVIGYLGGLATGITTYYFGGAMRSAVQTALQQSKATGFQHEISEPPPPPGLNFSPGVPPPADVGASPEIVQPIEPLSSGPGRPIPLG